MFTIHYSEFLQINVLVKVRLVRRTPELWDRSGDWPLKAVQARYLDVVNLASYALITEHQSDCTVIVDCVYHPATVTDEAAHTARVYIRFEDLDGNPVPVLNSSQYTLELERTLTDHLRFDINREVAELRSTICPD